jgi:hypothetical protein
LLLPVSALVLELTDPIQEFGLDLLLMGQSAFEAFVFVLELLGTDLGVTILFGRLPRQMHFGLFVLSQVFIGEIGSARA